MKPYLRGFFGSYVEELCALYERYKHVAGYSEERKLTVLEAPEAARRRKTVS